MIARAGERNRVARIALGLVIAGTIANLAFNLYIASKGFGAPWNSSLFGHPFNSFLFEPRDRFADTLKMAMGYPGPPIHPSDPAWGLNDKLALFQVHIEKLRGSGIDQFHMLPLSTLIGLAVRQAISVADPALVLLLALTGAAGLLAWAVASAAPKGPDRLWFAVLALISYPVIFAIDRGHLFSLVCAASLIAATARCLRDRRSDALTILLWAVAVNIRPTVGMIPLALFLCGRGVRFRDMVMLGAASVAMFAVLMAAAHAIFPAYGFARFLQGLRDYSTVYVEGGLGQGYNNSLFGALRGIYGYQDWTVVAPPVVALGLAAGACILARWRGIPDAVLIYLLLASYVLGEQVLVDYHLTVLLLPLLLLAGPEKVDPELGWIVLAGSCLLMIPKTYLYHATDGKADWSFQVVLNPVILLLSSLLLFYLILRGHAGQSAAQEVGQA
jgi:hypothetical protein